MSNTKKTVLLFDKYANIYQEKFMDVSLYHKSLDILCNNIINENAKVLELACGPGNLTNYILQKRRNINILATDLAPNMLDLAKKNNPSAHFQLLDCKNISQLNTNFDAIICGFGFPYLSKKEAIQFIKDSSLILNPNGILYLSTIEDDNKKSGYRKGSNGDGMYMNFHEASYIEKALKLNNFEILELDRVVTQNKNQTVTDLIIIAQNKVT
jgi:ubiquinone/menaquinone biosynthesis C-methylase UbiE